jgi:hypothetical protein
VLQNRCANLEEGNYSMYGSCRSSTSDILQGLRKPDTETSQTLVDLSEDSESKRATTNVVVQVWARLATQDPKADDVEHYPGQCDTFRDERPSYARSSGASSPGTGRS